MGNKYRNNINVEDNLRLEITNMKLDADVLIHSIQHQPSH